MFNYLEKMMKIFANPGLKDLWDRVDTISRSVIAKLSKSEYFWKDSVRIMMQTRFAFTLRFLVEWGSCSGKMELSGTDGLSPDEIEKSLQKAMVDTLEAFNTNVTVSFDPATNTAHFSLTNDNEANLKISMEKMKDLNYEQQLDILDPLKVEVLFTERACTFFQKTSRHEFKFS